MDAALAAVAEAQTWLWSSGDEVGGLFGAAGAALAAGRSHCCTLLFLWQAPQYDGEGVSAE